MKEEGYSTGSLLMSFLMGGIVGAGLALLVAPQSGVESRRKIRGLADDIKGKTTDYIEQTKGKMSSVVEQGKNTYEEKKSLVKSAIDAGKDAYEKEKENLSKKQEA